MSNRLGYPPNTDAGAGGKSPATPPTSQTIDWFHEGQARTVVVDGVEVTVRLVGRKGRRARIAITAPGGAVFQSVELPPETFRSQAQPT